jgi:phage major head subunit gpT-like protein
VIINSPNLRALFTGFKANFLAGIGTAPQDHTSFVTATSSTTAEEEYGWLGEMPGMRAWIGDRVLNNLKEYGFKIRNQDFEDTVQVPRNAIEDDRFGVYATPMEALGRAAGAHPCELSYAALNAGFVTPGYDGKPLFAADHPVLDANGAVTNVSNLQAGGGPAWFLIASGALVKPIILQTRQDTRFTALDNPDDANVFFRKQFIYGADARRAAAPGLWQGVFASRQALTAANYAAARAAMLTLKGDHGRPLGLKPDLLLVSGANESAALKIVNNEYGAAGESNEWKGTARVQVSSWLA